jgi:hypothetical protein
MPPAKGFVQRIEGENMPAALGVPLLVEPEGMGQGFRTILTGLERGAFLLARLPRIQGIVDELYTGRAVRVRYIHEGNALGFATKVAQAQVRPYRIFFLEYPEFVEVLNLRGERRVDCFIPARLRMGTDHDYEGMITNLSTGGCKLALDRSGEKVPGVEVGSILLICFDIPGQEPQEVEAEAKNVQADGQRLFLGCTFGRLEEKQRQAVSGYVESVSAYSGE